MVYPIHDGEPLFFIAYLLSFPLPFISYLPFRLIEIVKASILLAPLMGLHCIASPDQWYIATIGSDRLPPLLYAFLVEATVDHLNSPDPPSGLFPRLPCPLFSVVPLPSVLSSSLREPSKEYTSLYHLFRPFTFFHSGGISKRCGNWI
jgi:hypothetical protein